MARFRLRLLLLAALVIPLVAGCAAKRAYYWGDYDSALYSYYRNPQETERYLVRLGEIIQEAEVEKDKVPPGLYAEYGYALFEAGRLDEAIVYYRKERDEWQESAVFMDKMIRNTQRLKESRPGPPPGGNLPPPAVPVPEGGAK